MSTTVRHQRAAVRRLGVLMVVLGAGGLTSLAALGAAPVAANTQASSGQCQAPKVSSGQVAKNINTSSGCNQAAGTVGNPATGYISVGIPSGDSSVTVLDAFQTVGKSPDENYAGTYHLTLTCPGATAVLDGNYAVNQYPSGVVYPAVPTYTGTLATITGTGTVSCYYSQQFFGSPPVIPFASAVNAVWVAFDGGQFTSHDRSNSVQLFGTPGGPASPTITTQADPTSTITVGATTTVGDTATFSNTRSSTPPTGDVTFTLYSDSSCTTPAAGISPGTGQIQTNSAGVPTAAYSASWTPSALGTYYWLASYSGDANNTGYTTICGAANEELTVVAASPTITTQATPTSNITVGVKTTVGDTATFSNTSGIAPTGPVTFTLYSDSSCTTLAAVISGTAQIKTTSGVSTATFTASWAPATTGTYYWVASYSGDANNNGYTTACGADNEEVTVVAPVSSTVATVATPSATITVGTTTLVGDSAQWKDPTAAPPIGDVTFTLYSDSSCTTLAAVISGTDTISTSAGVSAAAVTKSWTPSKTGPYYWQASFTGSLGNLPFTTTCDAANEELTVVPASPTIATQAKPASNITVGVKTTVGDTATFSNTSSIAPAGGVTFTLYSDSSCTTPAAVISPGTGQIQTNSAGVSTAAYSTSWTPTSPGRYYWKASYSGDANNNGYTTACGAANEELTVVPASPTITTKATPTSNLTVGATTTVGDTATFGNTTSTAPTGPVTFTLYSDVSCKDAVIDGTVTISTSAEVSTAAFTTSWTPSKIGTYYWVASYSGDANNNGYTTTCDAANEELTVVTSQSTGPPATSPVITTQLSAPTVVVNQPVFDTATLIGATSTAGGTVTYTVYDNRACSGAGTSAGTVTVSNGTVPHSDFVTFPAAGTYYWQAAYSGDANNGGAESACTSEVLTVVPTGSTSPPATSPAISTKLSATSVSVNRPVFDTATLTGATSTAGGTVTYTVYDNQACSGAGTSAGTVTVSDGTVPHSDAVTFPAAGTYYWQAVYSGDANNGGAISACRSEVLFVTAPAGGVKGAHATPTPKPAGAVQGASTSTPGTGADLFVPGVLASLAFLLGGLLLLSGIRMGQRHRT